MTRRFVRGNLSSWIDLSLNPEPHSPSGTSFGRGNLGEMQADQIRTKLVLCSQERLTRGTVTSTIRRAAHPQHILLDVQGAVLALVVRK